MSALTATQAETLALFTSGADDLEQAIQGLSETELDYAGTPDGWTIRQIVHHIADDGDAWSMNFKKALATPGAPIRFEGFPGNDAWAATQRAITFCAITHRATRRGGACSRHAW